MIGRRDLLRAVAAGGLAFSSGRSFAQSKGSDRKKTSAEETPVKADPRVNDVLAPVRDEHHLPGLIGAILTGNRLAAIGALGIRKIGSDEPMRVTDQVHIGSCTKAMTATIIGMLVDEGKLTWGTRIRDLFPTAATRMHREFEAVTLSHLLTHRAGLPRDVSWWQLPGKTSTTKRRALLNTVFSDAPLSRPGSTYFYSNVGYAVAGLMAEHVSGQSWESLLVKRLFEPLEMTTAGFGSPGRAGRVDQPWGHRSSGNELRPTLQDNGPAMGPAANVHCSVPDWARFAALHLRGAQGKPKLLKRATFRALHTPPAGFQYSGGWMVTEQSWANGLTLSHNGSNTSWYASIWIAPVRDVAILVATNQGDDDGSKACEQAVSELVRSLNFLTQARRQTR